MLNDAKRAVGDIRQKFLKYMRHRQRVHCQRKAIRKIEDEMENYAETTKGFSNFMLIVADFKMKFEAMSSRETMPENFGKRGMGWHGFVGIFYEWNNELKKVQCKHIYVDQILSGNGKQDTLCVVSLLESFFLALISNFERGHDGFIKRFVFYSDNAGCYVSKLLIVMVGILNAKYKGRFFVERIIHTETQDGKGPCDCHFATAMEQCYHYMKSCKRNMITRINTPSGLAKALAWNDGIRNGIVQLVEIDRSYLLENYFDFLDKGISNKLKKYFSRVSDIEFELPTENDMTITKNLFKTTDTCLSESIKGLVLKFKVCAHSGFGEKIGFTIDFEKKVLTYVRMEKET